MELTTENWKDIPGYEGRYQVSDQGRVRSLSLILEVATRWGGVGTRSIKGKVLRAYINAARGGYRYVNLHDEDGQHMRRVARLVALSFLGPPSEGQQVRHINGICVDDRLENLAYGTPKENAADKYLHGTIRTGEKHHGCKLSDEDVRFIRASSLSRYELAAMFGVHHGHIYNVRAGFRRG